MNMFDFVVTQTFFVYFVLFLSMGLAIVVYMVMYDLDKDDKKTTQKPKKHKKA